MNRSSYFIAAVVFAAAVAPSATASASGPPQIPVSWVTEVTATGAHLRTQVNPNGLPTTYRFEYLTETSYETGGWTGARLAPPSGASLVGSGTSTLEVVQAVAGLLPSTTYRYRPVATNGSETTIGPQHLLTTQQGTNAFSLPDGRAWELVSPADKGGGSIAAPRQLFGGAEIQASATGPSAITYSSATSFGTAAGAPPVSQYVSSRGEAGWTTENVSAPLDSSAYGDHPDGAPYRLFSDQLTSSVLFGGNPCRGEFPECPLPNPALPGSGAPPGYTAYYLRSAAGHFASLLTGADFAHSALSAPELSVSLVAAGPDLDHLILSSCAALTADATEQLAGPGECAPAAQNLYMWSSQGLSLVNRLPGATQGTPGATIAAPIGALSGDGSRVLWTAPENGNLYLTTVGSQTRLIAGGGAQFQTSSTDGKFVFFTKVGHLYRYSASSQASTDLTPTGGVSGVLGASAAGDAVYFQDADGLELWREGQTRIVAPGAGATLPSDYPPAAATVRVSPDGRHLAFLSKAALADADNTDAALGIPDTELYLYGPPPSGGDAELVCVSCNPFGERPRGSASIPGALLNGSLAAYRPRVLSADGSRVFFESSDSLAIPDTNGQGGCPNLTVGPTVRPSCQDVYQWEAKGVGDCTRAPGCLGLISSGRDPQGAAFLDANAGGSDVYFLTAASLVGADPGAADIYDARVGGGLPKPESPIACKGDACQALPNPPDDPIPGTVAPNAGNPPVHYYKQRAKKHRRARHHHHRKHPRHRSAR